MTPRPIGWVGSLSRLQSPRCSGESPSRKKRRPFRSFGRTIKTVYFDHGFIVLGEQPQADRLGRA
jgi:hypothetical protein